MHDPQLPLTLVLRQLTPSASTCFTKASLWSLAQSRHVLYAAVVVEDIVMPAIVQPHVDQCWY